MVLLVEDDDDIRDTLAAVLDARGFQVIAGRNGRDALDQVRARGMRPAVILLDLLMPVMDGEQFLAEQPKDPLLAHVPVILITAQLRLPEVVPPNVLEIYRKPVRLNEILDAIRSVCDAGGVIPPALARGTGSLPHPLEMAEPPVSPEPMMQASPDEASRPGSDPGTPID